MTLALLLLAAAPAAAQPEQAAPGSVTRSVTKMLTKAATFELASSALETALFFGFHGAAAASGGVVFAVSFVTSGAVYLVHELAWDALTDAGTRPADPDVIAGKSLSYRVASATRSFAIGSLLGGAGALGSAAYAATVAVADTVLYAGSEYLFSWLRAKDGRAATVGTAP
ncbi:hypothetical protein STVA_38830 [Allostella vacuolata]|nr:hypothetical protein STVA_38830 [Stella vacuolata]